MQTWCSCALLGALDTARDRWWRAEDRLRGWQPKPWKEQENCFSPTFTMFLWHQPVCYGHGFLLCGTGRRRFVLPFRVKRRVHHTAHAHAPSAAVVARHA